MPELSKERHFFDSLCNTQRRYHYMCVVGTKGYCQEQFPRRSSAGSKHRSSPRHNSVPPSNTDALAPPREGRVKTVHPMANIQEIYLQVCQSSSRIHTHQKSHRSRIPYTSVGLPEGHSLVISPARQSPTLWGTCRLRLSPSSPQIPFSLCSPSIVGFWKLLPTAHIMPPANISPSTRWTLPFSSALGLSHSSSDSEPELPSSDLFHGFRWMKSPVDGLRNALVLPAIWSSMRPSCFSLADSSRTDTWDGLRVSFQGATSVSAEVSLYQCQSASRRSWPWSCERRMSRWNCTNRSPSGFSLIIMPGPEKVSDPES